MKRIIPIALISLLLMANSCGYMKKKGWIKDDKQELLAKAKADSIRTDSLNRVKLVKVEAKAGALDAADKAKAVAGKKQSGYDVIIGSFKVANYATAFAKEVEGMGYKTNILQSENGFNLVSIGHFESNGAAVAEIKKINEGNPTPMELWVY